MKNTKDIVKKVLDKYADTQLNIGSETARNILADDISKEIDDKLIVLQLQSQYHNQGEPGIDY